MQRTMQRIMLFAAAVAFVGVGALSAALAEPRLAQSQSPATADHGKHPVAGRQKPKPKPHGPAPASRPVIRPVQSPTPRPVTPPPHPAAHPLPRPRGPAHVVRPPTPSVPHVRQQHPLPTRPAQPHIQPAPHPAISPMMSQHSQTTTTHIQPEPMHKPVQKPRQANGGSAPRHAPAPGHANRNTPFLRPRPLRPQQGRVAPPAAPNPTAPASPQPARRAQLPVRQAAPPPPRQPRNAAEFLLRKGERPTQDLRQLRRERVVTRQGDRTIVREGDRTIVREHGRIFIRHNEAQRFAVGAANVRVERRGDRTVTVIERPDGVRIITVTDADGHLIRRVRRDPDGREVVIIDERGMRPGRDVFLHLPPPMIDIPRDRYLVDADRADPDRIYGAFVAPPVARLDRRYTLAQVRYNAALRDLMPSVDLAVHFDTGSWQLSSDQIARLRLVARQMNRVIAHDPREVFLIEGHTDAVGDPEDNLSLSDRRAEAVAVALAQDYGVPPENLVTQGYGEQGLLVQTSGPSRANRRVAIRNITPLIERAGQ